MGRLVDQIREALAAFVGLKTPPALIGFKLQGFVNDASRTRDIDDIRALLRVNRDTLDMQAVRRYFELFEREQMLDELLADSKR